MGTNVGTQVGMSSGTKIISICGYRDEYYNVLPKPAHCHPYKEETHVEISKLEPSPPLFAQIHSVSTRARVTSWRGRNITFTRKKICLKKTYV